MKFIFSNKKGVFYWFKATKKKIYQSDYAEQQFAMLIGWTILDQIENGEIKVKLKEGE